MASRSYTLPMVDFLKRLAGISGWTLLQVALFLLLFVVGTAAWDAVHGWPGNVGRGILWTYYFYTFAGLALLANLALSFKAVGEKRLHRVMVWGLIMLMLVLLTVTSWPALPLAVPFIHACALAAIVTREILRRLTFSHRLLGPHNHAL